MPISLHWDTPPPRAVEVGGGTVLFGRGILEDDASRLPRLRLRVNGRNRPDGLVLLPAPERVPGRWTVLLFVSIPAQAAGAEWELEMAVEDADGRMRVLATHRTSLLVGDAPARAVSARARVAVAMTTFRPRSDLLERQIDTIRAQTFGDWICIIADDASPPEFVEQIRRLTAGDPRFTVVAFEDRVGVYRNFERALRLLPDGVEFIAQADQDDAWEPDKLERQLAAFEPGVALVFSDMRVVDPEGRVLAPSFFRPRPNNYEDLETLIIANTVTGAASVFRRQLLEVILPFPPEVGRMYQDHWFACAALATGELRYVPRPLLDYVQHGSNLLGYAAQKRFREMRRRFLTGRLFRERAALPGPNALRSWHPTDLYGWEVLRARTFAETLRLRCGPAMRPPERRVVRRMARTGASLGYLAWLLARGSKNILREDVTQGAELLLVAGGAWALVHRWFGRSRG